MNTVAAAVLGMVLCGNSGDSFDLVLQTYGPRQTVFDRFAKELLEQLAPLDAKLQDGEYRYRIQAYVEPDGKAYGIILGRVSRGLSQSTHFTIPIDISTSTEAARDAVENIRMAVNCDLAGKGLKPCEPQTENGSEEGP